MKPGYYPLTIYCGTTLDAAALSFTYKVADVPVDLTGASIRASCRNAKGELMFDWSTANGKMVLDGPAGRIDFAVTAEETAALSTLKLPLHGNDNNMPVFLLGAWSMEIVTDRVERLIQGPCYISKEHVYG